MNRITTFSIAVSLLLSGCCSKPDTFRWKNIESHFSKLPSDSLKLKATKFLEKNSKDIQSENTVFVNFENKDTVDRSKSGISFFELLKKDNYYPVVKVLPDSMVLQEKQLIEEVELAYSTWQKYPWSRRCNFEMFCDFILPYKILNEAPDNWRQHIFSKIKSDLDSLQSQDTVSIHSVWKAVMDRRGFGLKYNENSNYLSDYSSFQEMLFRGDGECYRHAQMYAYVLRSAGIPASIAIVPMWGFCNGGHAELVYFEKSGKPKTYLNHCLNRAPKVFIQTFRKQNSGPLISNSLLDQTDALLPYLKNDHHLDATDLFGTVTDISYPLEKETESPIAYICAFNYGHWQPAFWGLVNKLNNIVQFKKMGTHILYRVMTHEGKKVVLGKVFSVEGDGILKFYPVISTARTSLEVSKWNRGKSYLKKGRAYTLQYMNDDSQWKTITTRFCNKDSSMKFHNIPKSYFYRLFPDSSGLNTSRIFEYKDGKIVWW